MNKVNWHLAEIMFSSDCARLSVCAQRASQSDSWGGALNGSSFKTVKATQTSDLSVTHVSRDSSGYDPFKYAPGISCAVWFPYLLVKFWYHRLSMSVWRKGERRKGGDDVKGRRMWKRQEQGPSPSRNSWLRHCLTDRVISIKLC